MFENVLFLSFISAAASFALTFLVTDILVIYLSRKSILDIPNARSSHTIPTPRGGGWALIGAQFVTWPLIALLTNDHLQTAPLFPLLVSALILMYISWLDDLRSVSPFFRLLCQALSVVIILMTFGSEGLFFQGLFPFVLDRILIVLAFIWWINLFNFMDGIDGISGQQTIFLCLGFAILFFWTGTVDLGLYSISLLFAALAFLVWNWHPARIFLGDIGSIFLGFITGWLMLHLLSKGLWFQVLFLPGFYYADATMTLLKRLVRKENIFKPHQQHFFQRPILNGLPAHKICKTIILYNTVLFIIALLAFWETDHLGIMAMIAIFTIVFLLRQLKKKKMPL